MTATARPRAAASAFAAPAIAAALVALLAACGGGSPVGPAPVVTVAVSPGSRTLTVGHPLQLTAEVVVTGGGASTAVAWAVVEGGAGTTVTPGGLFTPGLAGIFHVRATSVAQPWRFGEATVTVVAPPAVQLFHGTAAVTPGGTAILYADFGAGTARVDPGALPVVSGGFVEVAPAGAPGDSVSYLLTVTNAAGDTASATHAVTVVPPVAIDAFTADPTALTRGDLTTLTAVFSGGAGTLTASPAGSFVQANLQSGLAVALASDAPGATTVAYTLLVDSGAVGPASSATRTVLVHLYEPPVLSAFETSRRTITVGGSTGLRALFSGGPEVTATVAPGVGAVENGVPVAVSPAATTTYAVTVRNGAGATAAGQVTVEVVPPAGISSFGASPAAVVQGGTAVLDASYAGGVGVVTRTTGGVTELVGALPSGGTLPVKPAETTTYTLTVTNPAGDGVTASTTVTRLPGRWLATGALPPASPSSDAVLAVPLNGHAVLASRGQPSYLELDPISLAWSDTLQPLTDRNGGLGAAFGDGKLLWASGYPGLVTAEAWDPQTGLVQSTGPLANGRFHGTATPLLDGRVLLSGGNTATAELFEPGARTFSPTAGDLHSPRAFHGAARLLDGRVLVAAGATADQGSLLDSAEIFDPATGLFTLTGSLQVARFQHALVPLLDGRVLAIGGVGAAGRLDSLELWDPATGSWSAAGRLPVPVSGPAAVRLGDGTVLITGGMWNDAAATTTSVTWSPADGAVRPAPDAPGGSYGAAAALLPDGRALVAGGGLAPALVYDPEPPPSAP